MTREKVGIQLKKLRLARNVSASELARVCDKARQSVYAWESGAGLPDASTLYQLEKFYGLKSILRAIFEDDYSGLEPGEKNLILSADSSATEPAEPNDPEKDIARLERELEKAKQRLELSYRQNTDASSEYLEQIIGLYVQNYFEKNLESIVSAKSKAVIEELNKKLEETDASQWRASEFAETLEEFKASLEKISTALPATSKKS